MTSFDLTGKVAIITGASKGIGEAIAMAYARAGARVAVSSRKAENITSVAEAIEAAGGEALGAVCHVGDAEQVQEMVKQVVARWGGVDIAVNNAATNPHFGTMLSADEGVWEKILDVNLMGYLRVCKEVVSHMQAAGGGKIINIASVAGIKAAPGLGVYGVSKAAVIQLTRQLAYELGGDGITANAIAPGMIRTRFSQMMWSDPNVAEAIAARSSLGRLGEVEDVVGAALFLASPASDYLTGEVIVIDGGMTVRW